MPQEYLTCQYCSTQMPIGISTSRLSHCGNCDTCFYYSEDLSTIENTYIYFDIKNKNYEFAIYHRADKATLRYIAPYTGPGDPGSDIELFRLSLIPRSWTPQNIAKRVSKLLPFL